MICIPELPEVEILRIGLQKYIVGKTIEDVEVRNKRIFSGDPKDIIGATITGVERYGKGLVIALSNGYSLAIHIKLTGQLVFVDPSGPKETNGSRISKEKVGSVPNKFTHVIFALKASSVKGKGESSFLYYNDIRQFGWIRVVESEELKMQSFFRDLGPEFDLVLPHPGPLLKGEGSMTKNVLTLELFKEILSKSKLAIKPLIMDQKKMAGIGNIYANDGLYLAKIDPKRPAQSLSGEEQKRLYDALLTVLKKGLAEGGASELTFVNALGQMGNYQNHTLVYGKQGTVCKRCGTKIVKYMLGGRGTYVCPKCQK